ncbi:arylsulfatase [Devosia geojensis]|uniref:Arylsulfatase n=1 Tax=Devosia geojensis TaxID=443610 RepID=A0A0F5FR19_9HYPH|nr:aspartate/glutamate racemase family protein [Devosia geojensis]KKB11273.1 arylsulfatase [Devosia geojensis]
MSRIVLLHATSVAIEPVKQAFDAHWPEAELINLLDDGLSVDRARDAGLTEAMIDRFTALGRYGAAHGAEGILVTCSAFGPAIDRLAAGLDIPVLKPNEAMFRAAIDLGARIGMLATFAPAIPTMEEEFNDFARSAGTAATLETILVEGAMAELRAGNVARHNDLVAAQALALAGCDAIMLAQFSTAQAAGKVGAKVDVPVLTAPEAAVERMKVLVLGGE